MLVFQVQPQLKKNIFSGTFTAAGSIVISIIAYPIYLHFLSAELYGLWAILAVIIYFSSIGNFGIDEALIKYVAEEYEKKNIDNIIKYVSIGLNLLIANGIIIYVVLILFEGLLPKILKLNPTYTSMFNNIYPYIIFLSVFIFVVNFVNSVLKGLGRFDQASYIFFSSRVFALVISVLFFINDYKIWGLFWGQFLSFILMLILSSFFIYRKIGIYYKPFRNEKKMVINLLKFGGTLTISKLISMLLVPFIKVVIARYIGLAEVTYFEIANKIVVQIRSFFERGISAIMPEISRLAAGVDDTYRKISEIMKRVNTTNFLLGATLFILLFIVGEALLKLWLADEYNVAIVVAFRIIILGYLFNVLVIPPYYYFMGIGKVKYCFYNHFVQGLLNFVLIVFLVLTNVVDFKLLNAAYSLSVAISAVILMIIYYRKMTILLNML